ncbi:MAG: ABC transporter substrate-binding protein [Cyclobacteriaceae bacterium]|nr:ABC transporter substrate-binding protein [Cyclobacteriaceae bacterium]
MLRIHPLFLLTAVTLLFQCRQAERPASLSDTRPKYAEGFSWKRDGGALWVDVTYPFPGARQGYRYLLVKRGDPVPAHDTETQVIFTPVQRIVCTSTTHLPLLDYLGATQTLVGFPTTDYISSEKMRARVDAGQVVDVGVDKGMDLEKLIALKPDVVMGYSMSSDLGQLKKIKELGIPVVTNAEYLEKHPLGRAEWIRFMALLMGKEEVADSVFQAIEQAYLETAQQAAQQVKRPTVMSGVLYGDGWFLPGGKNYAARLLADAGCQYLWAADSTQGFLELSFESVYAQAREADLWIGVANFKTLAELKATEPRYELFKPFRQQGVYTYDKRHGARGGSEFLELGYLRPDLILKDLVKIAHPDLLPGYELFFHERLK